MKFILPFIIIIVSMPAYGQEKFINRKVAQKHYEGFILMQDGKYNEAIKYFDDALKDDPEAYFIYQNRAMCKLNLHDTTGAIADFKMNIKLEPLNTESRYAVGDIYKELKDTAQASEYFLKAIGVADEEFNKVKLAYMHQFLGNIDFEKKRYPEAANHFEKITEYFPEKSNYYIKKAVAYFFQDSSAQLCKNLELAYIYGESVPCNVLTYLCNGCSDLENQRIKKPANEKAIDYLLSPLLKDYHGFNSNNADNLQVLPDAHVKIFYNKKWDICLKENAEFYRDVYWSRKLYFFAGSYADYYINDSLFARGNYHLGKTNGPYEEFFPNGKLAIKGGFRNGSPIGDWKYFYEDGKLWMEIHFDNGQFTIQTLKDKSGNDMIVNNTGQVNIIFQTNEGKQMKLSGQLVNGNRDGEWRLDLDNKPLIVEVYKKNTFKKGTVYSNQQKIITDRSYFNDWIFVPTYLNKVSTLECENDETFFYYPFLSIFRK